MATVLYVTVNPKPVEMSYGLRLGRTFLDAYQTQAPNDTVQHLDLYKEEIPLIDGRVLGAWGKLAQNIELDAEEQKVLGRMNELLEQFLAADKVIFVTPMWNLSYPPMLKAYIDNIVIAGKTFAYTPEGPKGLAGGKRVLHIQSTGGIYSQGPANAFEFADKYLRGVLGFIGITDYNQLVVEGMAATPDKAEGILAEAEQKARDFAPEFAK